MCRMASHDTLHHRGKEPYATIVASQAGRGGIGKEPYATIFGLTGQSRRRREGTVCDHMCPHGPAAAAQGGNRMRLYVPSQASRTLQRIVFDIIDHRWPYISHRQRRKFEVVVARIGSRVISG